MVTDSHRQQSFRPKYRMLPSNRQGFQADTVLFEAFHQESRSAGLEPVCTKLHFSKSTEYAERIIDIYTTFVEVVTVVPFFQLAFSLFFSHAVSISKFFNFLRKIALESSSFVMPQILSKID